MSNASSTRRYPILSLPLVAPSHRLTQQLLPDALTPTPSSLLSVPESSPSLLRRSRHVGEGSHFSYLTPLPLSFPYNLAADAEEETNEGKAKENEEQERKRFEKMNNEEKQKFQQEKAKEGMEKIERLLRPYEVDPQSIQSGGNAVERLTAYMPAARTKQNFPFARILSISPACLKDCLPHLDVGDTKQWISSRSGKDDPDCYSSGPMAKTPSKEDSEAYARHQISDYLSGRLVGAQFPDLKDEKVDQGAELGVAEAKHQQVERFEQEEIEESTVQRWTRRSEALKKRQEGKKEWTGYAPWSNAYSGHQFGIWAGQLGDGRAITLMETENPETSQRWEIQLKGAGRTPYSRFADGLATLASSVREFLASEALQALNVPTSRALSVISVKDVEVVRERRVSAAITSRLAPIWIRIGSFEHHSSRDEWESSRLLGEFVCKEGYGWDLESSEDKSWVVKMIRECAIRNAKMIAGWQAVGFMHGVMNTDNISLVGITIDFGPYAFMDIFDPNQICNKSDGEGRYIYRMQPTMGLFAIEKLMESLSPLIAFESEKGRSPQPGEMVNLPERTLKEYEGKGQDAFAEEVKNLFMDTLIEEWKRLWRQKLAISTIEEDDRDVLIDPLLAVIEQCDFTTSLRNLSKVTEHLNDPEDFARTWIDWNVVPSYLRPSKQEAAAKWLVKYADRLKKEGRAPSEIQSDLLRANPAFVLRNWVTDEVTKRLEQSDDTDFLNSVLERCLHPFDQPTDEEGKVSVSHNYYSDSLLTSASSLSASLYRRHTLDWKHALMLVLIYSDVHLRSV